jgi:hypothetical protein
VKELLSGLPSLGACSVVVLLSWPGWAPGSTRTGIEIGGKSLPAASGSARVQVIVAPAVEQPHPVAVTAPLSVRPA